MKRTINYTGRKRLTNKNYTIRVNREGNQISSFDALFFLQELSLPRQARLYVEAYHLSDYARYDFGTVANPHPVDGTDLTRMGYRENLSFRVLIVDESGKAGRILASVDGIRPEKVGGQAKEETLLQVDFRDIAPQVWLLRYADDGEPVMVINDKLRGIAKTDIRFFVYIYPAVLREVLNHLVFVSRLGVIEDLEGWQRDWLMYAQRLTGGPPPEPLDPRLDDFDEKAACDWIDQAVKAFCNSHPSEWAKFVSVTEAE